MRATTLPASRDTVIETEVTTVYAGCTGEISAVGFCRIYLIEAIEVNIELQLHVIDRIYCNW